MIWSFLHDMTYVRMDVHMYIRNHIICFENSITFSIHCSSWLHAFYILSACILYNSHVHQNLFQFQDVSPKSCADITHTILWIFCLQNLRYVPLLLEGNPSYKKLHPLRGARPFPHSGYFLVTCKMKVTINSCILW